jgi:hypothetical protein
LERLLFACLLENASHELAETSWQRLSASFCEWKAIRVSSVRELSEIIDGLPDSQLAATRLKKVLQSVFEARYAFDLEPLRKQKLGLAEKELKRINGITSFGVAYVTQTALGGHAIAIGQGSQGVLEIVGIPPEDIEEGTIRGLTRAIAKNKGPEFFYLLHEFGVDFLKHPHSPTVREILLSIAPDARNRLPARTTKPKEAEAGEPTRSQPAAPEPAAVSTPVPPPPLPEPEVKKDEKKPAAAAKKKLPPKKAVPTSKQSARLAKRKPR